MKIAYMVVVFVSTAVGSAVADESLLTKKFSVCMDKSDGVTSSMLDCIGKETT